MTVEKQLNNREIDILNVLFKASEPLTYLEITYEMPELTQSTTINVIKRLLKREIIDVAGIKHSGTVLSRTYTPNEKAKEAMLEYMLDNYKSVCNILSKSEACKAILEVEQSPSELKKEIRQLKAMIRQMEEETKI